MGLSGFAIDGKVCFCLGDHCAISGEFVFTDV